MRNGRKETYDPKEEEAVVQVIDTEAIAHEGTGDGGVTAGVQGTVEAGVKVISDIKEEAIEAGGGV